MGLIPHRHTVKDTPHALREWVGVQIPIKIPTFFLLPSFKISSHLSIS